MLALSLDLLIWQYQLCVSDIMLMDYCRACLLGWDLFYGKTRPKLFNSLLYLLRKVTEMNW